MRKKKVLTGAGIALVGFLAGAFTVVVSMEIAKRVPRIAEASGANKPQTAEESFTASLSAVTGDPERAEKLVGSLTSDGRLHARKIDPNAVRSEREQLRFIVIMQSYGFDKVDRNDLLWASAQSGITFSRKG